MQRTCRTCTDQWQIKTILRFNYLTNLSNRKRDHQLRSLKTRAPPTGASTCLLMPLLVFASRLCHVDILPTFKVKLLKNWFKDFLL